MARYDLSQTDTTSLDSEVADFSVDSETIDESQSGEYVWNNPHWPEYLGYYKNIPELKQSIEALARWTAGKGYIANPVTEVILEHITGWGEDSFDSIMQNMIIVKKINGDSFAEIIRGDKDIIINIKPLNPGRMSIITDEKGVIKRYEYKTPNKEKIKFKPNEILHLCNERVANELHGTSIVESCKWIIDARNEAMSDWRRLLHRSTIRVIYVDAVDTDTISRLKIEYKTGINKGEVMIVPGKKGEIEVVDYEVPALQPFLEWIRYLENVFYQAVGTPKSILGGTQELTEASSKVSVFTFDQVWMTEQRLLEQDLKAQLGFDITFERPTSLKDGMQESESANTGQMGFQPNEAQVGMGRTE